MVTSKLPDRLSWLGSNLILGLLVTALSVFSAVTNYATYVASGTAADHETAGNRLLADSNTAYISASQFIIVDYSMYDSYYVNRNVDDFAATYYEALFSDALRSSVERNSPFDETYYTDMYADATTKFDEAFVKFDLANAANEQEAGYQLAMLIAAVGLAFAAYASLLDEANQLRRIFALMALIMLTLSVGQFLLAAG